MRTLGLMLAAAFFAFIPAAQAQQCTRTGITISCADGRTGIMQGETIVWPDGTRSSVSPHPSVRIGGNVRVGPGVFVGNPNGAGHVPLDDPQAPNKQRCAIVDSISYCH